MINNDQYPAIPRNAGQVRGWKSIPIKANRRDPLVPLGPLSQQAGIATSAIYFGEHSNSPYTKNKLQGSLLTLFARRSVARRLVAAEQLLPAGLHLLVFDAYRSYAVQRSLYEFYKQKLSNKYPNMDNAALVAETQKYVSLPSVNPARPAPHNTGGAVDVAIIKLSKTHEAQLQHIRSQLNSGRLNAAKRLDLEAQQSAIMRHHGKMLPFGTAFDHGGARAALAYYESKIATGAPLTNRAAQACNNRRLLFAVMTQAGFLPYFAEWWHFNAPESQMGAAAAGLTYATFGAANLGKNNKTHEQRRRKIHQKTIRHADDSTTAKHWPAQIIAP